MKFLMIFILLSLSQVLASQNIPEKHFLETLEIYEKEEYFENPKKDSLWTELNKEFSRMILNKELIDYNFDYLKKVADLTYFQFHKYSSEDKKYIIYSFHKYAGEGLNYLVRLDKIKSPKILLQDTSSSSISFEEIHNLSEDEVLLIQRLDEMVFTCHYASVYKTNKDSAQIKKNAFSDRDKLSVCTFTMLQGQDNKGEWIHWSEKPRKILFDQATKTISFKGDYVQDTEFSAKYEKGKFKIDDSDERVINE